MRSASAGIGPTDRAQTRASITDRLTGEFPILSTDAVQRQIDDASVCVRQLGLEVTPWLVERVAREHLIHLVQCTPPPGQRPRWFR